MSKKSKKVKSPAVHRKGQEKKAKLGKPLRPDFSRNCLACFNFASCRDPEKSRAHLCSKFSDIDFEAPENDTSQMMLSEEPDIKERKRKKTEWFPPEEMDDESLQKYLLKAMSRKVEIDDSAFEFDDTDLPTAKNFLQFTASKRFLGMKPYPKQVEWGINFRQEYCPRCSDLDWITNIPKKTSLNSIREHATLLEHGVCPDCGATKSELVKSGELVDYYEFAGMVGQRCITGNSIVLTGKGPQYIKNILHGYKPGMSRYYGAPVVLENGGVVQPAGGYVGKSEVRKVVLRNNFSIKGTPVHPIMTHRGWVHLDDLQAGDAVPVYYGQNVWGSKIPDPIRDIRPAYKRLKGSTRPKSNIELVLDREYDESVFRLLGWWVAEGVGGQVRISNHDKEVLDDIELGFSKIMKAKVLRNDVEVRICSKDAKKLFNVFLGGGIESRSAQKFVPPMVLEAPRHMVREFLSALFEGDGGVSGKVIEYCSLSKRLINEVSALLSNFGVPHSLSKRKTFATNGTVNQKEKTAYRIFICGKFGLSAFRDSVGFWSNRKKAALDAAILEFDERSIEMPFFYEKFPNCIKQEFLLLVKEAAESISLYRAWDSGSSRFLSCNLGINSIIDSDHPDKRLFAPNVALSRQRLSNFRVRMSKSKAWGLVSEEVKKKFNDFYSKYDRDGVYWSEVVSVKKCRKEEKVYDFHVPGFNRFMANGILNHNSGKTAFLGLDAAYCTHLFLKTPSPAKTFRVTDNMVLYATFAAVTFDQAIRNVWAPYVRPYITITPWFRECHKMLEYYSEKSGMQLVKSMETFVSFNYKGIMLSPYTPDKRTLRGATRYYASVDELGWFDTSTNTEKSSGVRANSAETVAALSNSLMTLKNEHRRQRMRGNNTIPNPMMVNISSPSSADDGICQRIKAAKVDPQIYAVQAPTWKISPKYSRKDPEIVAAFAVNKINAARDWGAEPPFSRNAFLTNFKMFKSIISDGELSSRKNAFRLKRELVFTDAGVPMTGAEVKIRNMSDNNRLMAIDAGSINNSFAIAVGRVDAESDCILLEGLGEIIPIPGKEISFNNIYNEVICPLIEELGVGMIVADRWQSKKLLQDAAEEFEIESREYSLKMPDFLQYRETIVEGKLILPKPEIPFNDIRKDELGRYPDRFEGAPVAHFIHQNFSVVETLKSVEKGLNRTDDLFRAVVLMVAFLNDLEIRSEFSGFGDDSDARPRNGLGLVTAPGKGQGVSSVPGIGVVSGMSSSAGTGAGRVFSGGK